MTLSGVNGSAQSGKYDSIGILIFDRMSNVIGDLESCSFKLTVANDEWVPSKGLTKYFSAYEVFMGGPNKMLVDAQGLHGHRRYIYNGTQMAYYSFTENNYSIIPAPDNTIKMIDSLHEMYDIEFPAVDFFYPAFTDDLLHDADSLRFIGLENVGNNEYLHLFVYGRDMDFQFWVNSDAYSLPARFSITYKTKQGTPQYLAMFSDWQINPKFPDAIFDFLPPPNATKIRMMSKNDK
jgi:hypothetical protein